jgi:hypothetical protein
MYADLLLNKWTYPVFHVANFKVKRDYHGFQISVLFYNLGNFQNIFICYLFNLTHSSGFHLFHQAK